MGEKFLITGDGWNEKMQMAVGVLNGIESEGLAAPNDGWRRFSRMLNVQTYWQQHNHTKHRYSYITAKLRDLDDLENAVNLRRLGAASASCLGVAYTQGGDYNRRDGVPLLPELTLDGGNWLGQTRGEMAVTALLTPDLLASRSTLT